MQKIRLWKLGSLEHKIFPTQDAIDKLAKVLEGLIDDEFVDIIWGPDIECTIIGDEVKETKPVGFKFKTAPDE